MQNESIGKTEYSKSFWISIIAVFILVPVALYFTLKLGSRYYYVMSIVIMFISMIPFFVSFEKGKPGSRYLVTLAVMCAIAVMARTVFIWAPNFKPIGGIIMITAMAFGPEAGFMTGSLSLLTSDIIFGQGPWTPWQMFGYGMLGFITGYLAKIKWLEKHGKVKFAIIGFILQLLVVGPILDTCALFTMPQTINISSVLAIYISGVPINFGQGVATLLTVFFLKDPIMDKLIRLKTKYGVGGAIEKKA